MVLEIIMKVGGVILSHSTKHFYLASGERCGWHAGIFIADLDCVKPDTSAMNTQYFIFRPTSLMEQWPPSQAG
jgi:hypothetical protein